MELNTDIVSVLKEFRIDVDQGLLVLLGYHFELDVDKVCSEEVIKQINLTKIVVKDYTNAGTIITWNMPLFKGQEVAFGWVNEWVNMFGRVNPDRRGSPRDAITRMKTFFSSYPEYRKEDVIKATQLYLASLDNSRFCMKSHKFIFDGAGAMKKSELLGWCERVKKGQSPNQMKGKLL